MINEPGYFFNPIKRDIAMIQGDTCSFGFQVQGLEGERPSSIFFTCKETIEDEDPLFQVDNTNNIHERSYDSEKDILTYGVRIPPYLTHNIALGRYFYDLQVQVNGDIITLMSGRLTLEGQTTNNTTPPPPPIEDGDNTYYPRLDVDPTTKKLYTEKSVNDIADAINLLYGVAITGQAEPYKISEMAPAIETASDYVVDASDAIKEISDITSDTTIDYLPYVIRSLIWEGTQEEYEDLPSINPNTLYIIIEEEE